jgi:serine/threonine protein kinase/class 3 adenylate cyclase
MSLDRYRLLAQLGAGTDGISYRAAVADAADGQSLDGTVVELRDVSRASEDAGRWGQLVPRVRLAARLKHPSVVRVLDPGLDRDPPDVALEWVSTATLAEAASPSGRLPRGAALELAGSLAAALEEAHRLGLAHGRLGPGQVFLVDGRPKLDFTGIDAGLPVGSASSRALDADCRDPQALAGGGPAAERAADLYSLGMLLVWLLTGGTGREDRELCMAGLDSGPILGPLIRDLLADEPADRPMAREVRERLDDSAPSVASAPTSVGPRSMAATGDWVETRPTLALSGAAIPPAAGVAVAEVREPGTLVLEAGAARLGRYRLLEKLGEGGQGIVYRAEDPAVGAIVAIKVLRSERANDAMGLRRFRKEARILAEANNPQVVNLLEYNEENGIPYLVLEFVSGEGLDRLLRRRTRLDEREALAIMAEVTRGLMAAHERGIVHRDIKPSNVLLIPPEPPGDGSPRVKISDFGLARHVVDSESMALTAAGALLGTPHYMAPEQWTGRSIDARTDVYALGATLFHLLAGRPPFDGPTRDSLAAQHCNAAPPPLAAANAAVSEGVIRVVERAMAKRPEDRYVEAGAMLRDLEALLHGEPTGIPMHPILPARDPDRVLRFEFRWDLESSPRQLWPLVTDTDRLDRAIGFPALKVTTRYEEGRGVRTFAEGRKAGMTEIGEEHPYEWVEPRRMGVMREYSQGPFVWVVSTVELRPRPGGGTTLVHSLRFEPRTWTIRVGSRWGVGVGLRKSLEKIYRRIDATVQGRARRDLGAAAADPFAEPDRLPVPRRQRLDRLLDRLAERGVDAAVVERLGEYLACGSAQEVARIRPLALAERLGLDPDQMVAACLHGAREGLLALHWDLLCPVCRISCQVTDTLRAIAEHAHCAACHLDFQLDFARSIELIFRVHPEIRAADLGTYCIGGPAHSPHVPAQVRVAPGERIELELELSEGSYRIRGPQLPWTVDIPVRGSTGLRQWELALSPGQIPAGPAGLRAGGQVLVLTNGYDRELVVRVERVASRNDALTAARAASLALFRELFPNEVLAPGQLATVSTVTFLVTALDPAQADALYQDLGDARAFGVIHEHFRRLGDAIRQGGGAVVKTQGEGLVASFSDVTAAVRTALELQEHLAADEATRSLRLRIGVHRGPALATTVNDQLDYFGTTARQAARTLDFARAGELVLTQTVAADPEVAALLGGRQIATEVVPADLGGQGHVIRTRPDAAGRASSVFADPGTTE